VFYRTSSTVSHHINLGFSTRRLPSGLINLSFLKDKFLVFYRGLSYADPPARITVSGHHLQRVQRERPFHYLPYSQRSSQDYLTTQEKIQRQTSDTVRGVISSLPNILLLLGMKLITLGNKKEYLTWIDKLQHRTCMLLQVLLKSEIILK
jgi:hypothetical protein